MFKDALLFKDILITLNLSLCHYNPFNSKSEAVLKVQKAN